MAIKRHLSVVIYIYSSTIGNPYVGVWCHAIHFYMITANGIVRGIDESSSDAEFKESSSQKVIFFQDHLSLKLQ